VKKMVHAKVEEIRRDSRPMTFPRTVEKREGRDREGAEWGICETCTHRRTCLFRKGNTRPVIECNEYEGADTVRTNRSGREEISSEGVPGSYYKGLCGNCENRAGCMFASTEGGVWHCEEYR
jgi:hypothetical protein